MITKPMKRKMTAASKLRPNSTDTGLMRVTEV